MKWLLAFLAIVGLVAARVIDGGTGAVLLLVLLVVRLGPFGLLRLALGVVLMVRGLG
jgi:hypothetical protein